MKINSLSGGCAIAVVSPLCQSLSSLLCQALMLLCWTPIPVLPAEALRFGGISTKQNDGSILAYLWDQGKPLLTQTAGAILGEHIFLLRYFCSLCLWYAVMLHYSYGDIWKDIAWHM